MKGQTRYTPSDRHSSRRTLAWLAACAVLALLAAILGTTSRRQPAADPSSPSSAQTEARGDRANPAPAQKSEAAPRGHAEPPGAGRATATPPQQADPFKAFLQESKSGQRPPSPEPVPRQPAGQTAEREDPFKSIAETTKNRSQEVTKSPFGR
jgi:hypothetical protein